jgi:hypothetical protein
MIIHRYWTGPDQPPYPAWASMIAAANPEHDLVDYTDDTLPGHIRETADRVTSWVHPDWAQRHRANIVRLELLLHHGGYWLDHDLLPLVALDTLPFPATAAHDTGSRCNCFLAFNAHDDGLLAARDHALGYLTNPTRHRGRVGAISGEQLIDRYCDDNVARVPMLLTTNGKRRPGQAQLLHLFGSHTQPHPTKELT